MTIVVTIEDTMNIFPAIILSYSAYTTPLGKSLKQDPSLKFRLSEVLRKFYYEYPLFPLTMLFILVV